MTKSCGWIKKDAEQTDQYIIMAKSAGRWFPVNSCGKTIIFLSAAEADEYAMFLKREMHPEWSEYYVKLNEW